MNNAAERAAETYTISEIYALEDELFLYEGPLPDDSEEEESPLAA